MNYLYLDIETCAADDAKDFKPKFEAPGNFKDPEKIKEAIVTQEVKWRESLALSALTGRVLVVGLLEAGRITYCEGDEGSILEQAWGKLRPHLMHFSPLLGWNIHGFDLPFMLRRSWKLGVKMPMQFIKKGRYFENNIVDLMAEWAGAERRESVSLDVAARFMGVGSKKNGATFAARYAENPDQAKEYLKNDLLLVEAIGKRMGYEIKQKTEVAA